jgi:hypothetical protein
MFLKSHHRSFSAFRRCRCRDEKSEAALTENCPLTLHQVLYVNVDFNTQSLRDVCRHKFFDALFFGARCILGVLFVAP